MDMTGGKMFKGGVVAVAAIVLAYFVYQNWDFWSGRVVDHSVSMSGPASRPGKKGEDHRKVWEWLFATGQEKMTLIETDIDGQWAQMAFEWAKNPRQMNDGTQINADPARDRAVNPLERALTEMSDPRRRLWLRNVLFNNRRDGGASSFVVLAGLDASQKAAETELRQSLNGKLTILADDAKDGSSNQAAFKKIKSTVEAARANANEPEKDPKKADQIRAVINAARDYEEKINEQRISAAQVYIDGVQKLLTDKQTARLDEFMRKLMDAEQQTNTPVPNLQMTNAPAPNFPNTGAGGSGGGGAGGGRNNNRQGRGNASASGPAPAGN